MCPLCQNEPPWDDEPWLDWYVLRRLDLGVCGCPDEYCEGTLSARVASGKAQPREPGRC